MDRRLKVVLVQETAKIITTALATDQIHGLDIEMRIATVYDAFRRAVTDTGVKDLPSFEKSSGFDEEEMLEVERVIEREARSPKLNIQV